MVSKRLGMVHFPLFKLPNHVWPVAPGSECASGVGGISELRIVRTSVGRPNWATTVSRNSVTGLGSHPRCRSHSTQRKLAACGPAPWPMITTV